MVNEMKKELLDLIEKIQVTTGWTQGQIAEKAGYAPNYLSEAISKNIVSKKLIRNLQGILQEFKNGVPIKDAAGELVNLILGVQAKVNILLSNEAEKNAEKSGRKSTDVLREMNTAVRLEYENLKEALRKRELL